MKLLDIIVTTVTLIFIVGGVFFGEYASKKCEKEDTEKR